MPYAGAVAGARSLRRGGRDSGERHKIMLMAQQDECVALS
ncbi:hypothetical protein ETAE_0922 [Edwardsiella piscicida]|uniref:Uncharacterized protein n=1 Tax=Edwardsiella piscicida TaxID=1263550 RepID=A0AAU8PI81_EDWPI|nr:hypothetical protein ETAE_0922 [Edwardsiella tarda EIB202]